MNFISKKYQNWSIFYKILFFFAIIIALLFSLTLFNFFTYYRQTETRSITALQAAANQSSNEINTYLSDIAALTQIPLAKKVDDIDVAYALNHLEKGTASQMEISALHKLLNDILDYKKDVHSVFLFTPAGKVVYDFQFIALTNDFKIQNTIWFQDLMNSSGKAQSLPPFSLRYYEDLVSKNDYMFSTGRAIRMVSSNQLTGAIIINTSIQYLKNIVSNMLSYQNQRIIIADADGTVIYDTDEVNIGQAIDASLFSLFSEQTFPEHFTLNNTRCLLGHATVQNSGWHLLNIVPLHSLNHQLYSTAAKTGFSIVGICFLAIVITSVISHHIVGPLQELVEQMKSVNYEYFVVALKDER
ncbi:MAG: cache domain-containing protein [Ruthenibacterium sp.]